MTDSNLLTVTELGQYAPDLDLTKYDNPTISGMISAASKEVSDYLEYTPYAEDINNEIGQGHVSSEGDLIVYPQKIPILTVSSLALVKGTTELTLQLQDSSNNDRFNIDFNKRNLRMSSDEALFSGTVTITDFLQLRGVQFYTKISYRAGWEVSNLPQTIKQATILFFRDMNSSQFNPTGATSLSQGQVSFGFGGVSYKESKLVKDAKRLLGPYRRIG